MPFNSPMKKRPTLKTPSKRVDIATIPVVLPADDGTFFAGLLVPDGESYFAYVNDESLSEGAAMHRAKFYDINYGKVDRPLPDSWTPYTNAAAPLDWFRQEGFIR